MSYQIIKTMLLEQRPLEKLLQKGASADEIQNQAVSSGMKLMFADGFTKVARGQTSIEEILRVITE